MRIYVIGPVSGFDDLNLPAFADAGERLFKAGYTAMIPHDFVAEDATWQQAMRRSLEILAKSDGVAMLPGCEKSNGALLEAETARKLGIPVMTVESWTNLQEAQGIMALARTTKKCNRCKRVLPFLLFGRAGSSWDGRQAYCRDCMAGYKRERRSA